MIVTNEDWIHLLLLVARVGLDTTRPVVHQKGSALADAWTTGRTTYLRCALVQQAPTCYEQQGHRHHLLGMSLWQLGLLWTTKVNV